MLLSSAGDRGKNMYRNEMHVEFLSISQNESLARMVVAAFITQLNPTIYAQPSARPLQTA